jgi:hypothetical protein
MYARFTARSRPASLSTQETAMPTAISSASISDAERAGRALAHPFVLLLPRQAVAALSDIATSVAPATTAERRLLGEVLRAIDAAEVAISRRAA